MANRVKFGVSAIPIEALTDANGVTHDILASEINTSLGCSGDSVSINNYNLTAAEQGYKDATVNYVDAVHTSGGTNLSTYETCDFIFIKNTGYVYSSAAVPGASTTNCVLVAIKLAAYINGGQSGHSLDNGVGQIVYIELAFLQPGQGVVLPLGAKSKSITQYGANAQDLIGLNEANGQYGFADIMVKTVQSDGTAASDGNAVEYLLVD